MTKHEQCVYIIEKFVKAEKTTSQAFKWPVEVKFAKKLLSIRPFDYWEAFDLPFELNTISFFLRDAGKEKMEEFDEQYAKMVELAPESNYNEKTALNFIDEQKSK